MKNRNELDFIYKACQALSFWIGYSHELYWQRDLVEAALVTELLKLLNAKKRKEMALFPEFHLNDPELLKNSKNIKSKERIDIVIKEYNKIQYAIEIKRAKAPKEEILEDVRRLMRIKSHNEKIKCLLIIASQKNRPAKFVAKNGCAAKGTICYREEYPCKVRRVLKSNHTFKNTRSANYVCIIEILNKSTRLTAGK